ncbi:MAG: phosphatase PAP2 family protein [Chloroflexi bacterium]|nr:phosphatase PAP2 family protein [Chloroflexota bacterium]
MSRDELFALDVDWTHRFVAYTNGHAAHKIAWLLSRTGDSWLWGSLAVLLIWQVGRLGWVLLITIFAAAGIVALLKGVFKRARPVTHGREIAQDKYSFPSGHAARVGAVAVFAIFLRPQWALLIIMWAVLVSFSRVARSRHYLADVFIGLILGILIGISIQMINLQIG